MAEPISDFTASDTQAEIVCTPLSEPIVLNQGNEQSVATIQTTPLHSTPKTLDALVTSRRKHPLYFGRIGIDSSDNALYCSYPIDAPLFRENPTPTLPATGLNHFGLKTEFTSEFPRYTAGFILGENDLIYGQSMVDGTWFLVGTKQELDLFLAGLDAFYTHLLEEWREKRWEMFQPVIEMPSVDKSIPSYSAAEANAEIDRFLEWLSQYKPELHQEIAGNISYQSFEDMELAARKCGHNIPSNTIASFNPDNKKVTMNPKGIWLLKQKKYVEMTLFLTHETAHQHSWNRSYIIPSEEIFLLTTARLLAALRKVDLSLQTEGSEEKFFTQADCAFYFWHPEEEAYASATSLLYGRFNEPEEEEFFELASTQYNAAWTTLRKGGFPPEALQLALNYYLREMNSENGNFNSPPYSNEVLNYFDGTYIGETHLGLSFDE